jgi:lactoylglutathione lyase
MWAMETTAAPNVRESVPFLWVTDIEAALRFYVDGLGFRVALKWEPEGRIRWCRLEHGAAAMMLQEFSAEARPRSEKLGVGMSICFMCSDALAIHARADAAGLSPKEPFVGNGLWIVELLDPDGYRIAFESPTDVAEDTTLSEWRAAQGSP